jgi:hypothetical protein
VGNVGRLESSTYLQLAPVTEAGGELDCSFDLPLCGLRWKHQQSHDESDNYSKSNLEKSSNRGLRGSVVDFNQNDD